MFFNSFNEETRRIFNNDIEKFLVYAWIIFNTNYQVEEYKGLKQYECKFSYLIVEKFKDKDFNINQLNLAIKKLPQDHHKELEQIKNENELKVKLEVAEVKEDLNNKLNQQQLKYNNEIEKYQNKYKLLLEEIENKSIKYKVIKKGSEIIKNNK
ncbi:hypothetical protein [Clostridium sp.]|uniref:hypothetical protein n=1 Tax=Clostridium sp. TaxID=1506 RepID=UPI003D6D8CC3